MNRLLDRYPFLRIGLLTVFVSTIISGAGYVCIRAYSLQQIQASLLDLRERIAHGIRITDGTWDTSLYVSDPHTPHPSGSSGFIIPLYILTADGFVIERNQPITGLFDSSDYDRLLSFKQPQTINTITNEKWRVYSLPAGTDESRAVVFVSYYNPPQSILEEIDVKLQKNAQTIASNIRIVNGNVDVSAVDIRAVDYDVAFEIVNQFNTVLLNNGRTPSFIDKSYVASGFNAPKERYVRDTATGETFLVLTTPLPADAHRPSGLVVIGESVSPLQMLLWLYTQFAIVSTLLLGILMTGISYILHRKTTNQKMPGNISFNKKESAIHIGPSSIDIPYDSNQYYVTEALFSSPKKRWELDELLERIGAEEKAENWRKIYDAVAVINRKSARLLPDKLIILKDKTYQINTKYADIIQR